jgi:hypothetical protein
MVQPPYPRVIRLFASSPENLPGLLPVPPRPSPGDCGTAQQAPLSGPVPEAPGRGSWSGIRRVASATRSGFAFTQRSGRWQSSKRPSRWLWKRASNLMRISVGNGYPTPQCRSADCRRYRYGRPAFVPDERHEVFLRAAARTAAPGHLVLCRSAPAGPGNRLPYPRRPADEASPEGCIRRCGAPASMRDGTTARRLAANTILSGSRCTSHNGGAQKCPICHVIT